MASDPFDLERDAQLVHYLRSYFRQKWGLDLAADALALTRLTDAARDAQAELREHEEAELHLPAIAMDRRGRPIDFIETLTRDDMWEAERSDEFWPTFDLIQELPNSGPRARPSRREPEPEDEAPILLEPGEYSTNLPVNFRRFRIRWRWPIRVVAGLMVLFFLAIGWLVLTAPLSRSLQPPTPPSITLLAADGTPIARRGSIIDKPVDVAALPPHIAQAFLAIEDRRFYSHWGVDPRGITRAFFHNVTSSGRSQGGSTITQQLAKNAFLDSDRTASRKIREVLIAFWLEAWLTKDEILSRYLSNVYFGDNVYGLRAASKHYFGVEPDRMSIGQAAMLAGLVKAPSRLAPTENLKGAQAREALVVAAMEEAGFIDHATALSARPATVRAQPPALVPNGTYFADWVLPAARERAGEISAEAKIRTTLDTRLQKAAEKSVARAGLGKAQVALVAMRPDGQIVAMVGGKNYAASPFNRATQARRQPGSAFKLFVYLAAMRSGMTPDSMMDDNPITIADWSPKNNDGRYLGPITLRQAFARSSNVVAARLIQKVGVREVIRAARDLGITTEIPNEATIALGTATLPVIELTQAYAAIANGSYPVAAHGLDETDDKGWLATIASGQHPISATVLDEMRDLLSASATYGTGKQANLSVPTFGKTGTTQDSRDAWFMGYAGNLVVGVWVGNDDNSPSSGLHGGGLPASIWRDFMMQALRVGAAEQPEAPPVDNGDDLDNAILPDEFDNSTAPPADAQGFGLNLRVSRDGDIQVTRPEDQGPPVPPLPPPSARRREPGTTDN